MGSAVAGTLEGLAAHSVTPLWLQVLSNLILSLVIFACGCGAFGMSHEWVLKDPKLEPPLWAITVCVVS